MAIDPIALRKRDCESGDGPACYKAGNLSAESGKAKTAAELYDKGCKADHAASCNSLGAMYAVGDALPKDLKTAVSLYEKACEGNDSGGCVNLADCYLGAKWCSGVLAKSPQVALRLRQKACDLDESAGNVEEPRKSIESRDGCYALGHTYYEGDGVRKDYKRALAEYMKSCARYPKGCWAAGWMYEGGRGTPRDVPRAVQLSTQACAADVAEACLGLGVLFGDGKLQKRDPKRAIAFYEKACALGNKTACDNAESTKRFEEEGENRAADLRAAQEEQCGKAPALSAWDGELPGAERILRDRAHDPDSIDVENCTRPVFAEGSLCWVSMCDLRGKNAFGARVLSKAVFAITGRSIRQLSDKDALKAMAKVKAANAK